MNHLMHQDEILLQIVNRLDRGDREMKRLARRARSRAGTRRAEAETAGRRPERPIGVPAP